MDGGWARGGELSTMKSGILMMMMCCCRPSPPPCTDDVLAVASTCLPVATLVSALGPAHSPWNGLQNSENNQNIKPSLLARASCRAYREQLWKNNSTYKKKERKQERNAEVLPSSPPADGNLRSRQECARAWLWLIAKQISKRRQVCSACPHSC